MERDIVTPHVIEEVYGIPVMIRKFGGVRCFIPRITIIT